jgi:hypothetical protein
MVRKYNTRKRAHSTRNRRRQTKKTYKHIKGGTKYNSGLDFPFNFTYQDITDNIEKIEELNNPTDINSYEVGKVYIIQFMNNDQYYYQYRVKDIVRDEGGLLVVPVIPKGKKYSYLKPTKIYVNNIRYSYFVLPKYDNNEYYETQQNLLDTGSQQYRKVPDNISEKIFSYLKR